MATAILSVELGQRATRALVVERRGNRARITASAEVSVARRDDPDEALTRVLEALGKFPKSVVLVSGHTQTFTCQMGLPPSQALAMRPEQLEHAARFEVEPYVEFPASDGLYSVDMPTRKPRASAQTTPVRVAVIYRRQYEHFEAICRRHGLRLKAMYPTDMSFALSGVDIPDPSRFVVLLDVRPEGVRAALANGADLLAARNVPASVDEALIALNGGPLDDPAVVGAAQALAQGVQATLSEFGGDWACPHRVVVCGDGSRIPSLVEAVRSLTDAEQVSAWNPDLTAGTLESLVEDLGGAYASAAGGALQELDLTGGRRLGVDLTVGLGARARESLHLAPFALVLVTAAIFGVFYYMGHRRLESLKTARARLETEVEGLESTQARLERQEERYRAEQARQDELQRQIRTLELLTGPPGAGVAQLLRTVAEVIPETVVVQRLAQAGPDRFVIEGLGASATAVSTFNDELQKRPDCVEARLEAVHERNGGARALRAEGQDGRQGPGFRVSYRIVLRWNTVLGALAAEAREPVEDE